MSHLHSRAVQVLRDVLPEAISLPKLGDCFVPRSDMLNVTKYDKSRIEIPSSAVFYLPRDIPVEDFYRPGTQEKKIVP